MPKNKRKRARRRVTRKKVYRRKRDKRMPLSGIVGLSAMVLNKPSYGWASPLEAIQMGKPDLALQSALCNLTGIRVSYGGYSGPPIEDIGRFLNPLDMNFGAAWKTALISGITAKLVNRFTSAPRDMIDKIPFLNKFVKFA